jgi:5-methylthioadenosine/S-adenosylhomocysteine deaminase
VSRALASRRVVTSSKSAPVAAVVRIEGSRIAAVEPVGDYARAIADETILDFGDRPITPAFIDAHTHLALAFLRGLATKLPRGANLVEDFFFRYESRLTADDVAAFVRASAYESLLCGVGLVYDHYYFGEAVAGAIAESGLSAVIAPTLQDLSGPGRAMHDRQLEATSALASERWAERGIFAALGPHATDTVSATLMERALALAEAERLPVHVHVAQSVEEYRRSFERAGCSPFEWLARVGVLDRAPSALFVHALFASDADLDRLDPARHALGFCPFSQVIFGIPARADRWREDHRRFFVATDCAASNDAMNVQKELRFLAGLGTASVSGGVEYDAFLREGGVARADEVANARVAAARFEAGELLERVWEVPGSLHPGFTAGVLAPGALANLVVWNREHPSMWPLHDVHRALAFGDTAGAVHAMFVGGREIGRAGDFHASVLESADYLAARAEATERLEKLLARA